MANLGALKRKEIKSNSQEILGIVKKSVLELKRAWHSKNFIKILLSDLSEQGIPGKRNVKVLCPTNSGKYQSRVVEAVVGRNSNKIAIAIGASYNKKRKISALRNSKCKVHVFLARDQKAAKSAKRHVDLVIPVFDEEILKFQNLLDFRTREGTRTPAHQALGESSSQSFDQKPLDESRVGQISNRIKGAGKGGTIGGDGVGDENRDPGDRGIGSEILENYRSRGLDPRDTSYLSDQRSTRTRVRACAREKNSNNEYETSSSSQQTKGFSSEEPRSETRVKINNFAAARKTRLELRSKLLKSTRDARTERRKATGQTSKKFEWSKLDLLGNPVVSFDPNHPNRKQFMEVLAMPAKSSAQVKLVRKLGSEFSRIYERYRREAERNLGRSYSEYTVPEPDRRHCEEAAVNCMLRGVTPRQLLEYWDSRVKDFTDGNLVIPSLTFLKSPSNIDRVVVSNLGKSGFSGGVEGRAGGRAGARPVELPRVNPLVRNPYSNTPGLDPRLRPALERAGFTTQAFNDRYLLSIQLQAMGIASGKNIFLAKGKFRDMVLHAAREVYGRAAS